MLTLTSFRSPWRSCAILSSTGETAWHVPRHSVQKSTRTGVSFELSITSLSNVASVTSVAIFGCCPFSEFLRAKTSSTVPFFPLSRIESMPNSFAPLPRVPDHPALEEEILELWDQEG